VARLKAARPGLPVIGFPRGAGPLAASYAERTGVDGVAFDEAIDAVWARDHLQPLATVQGNLDPRLLVTGGEALDAGVDHLLQTLGGGPFVFNLGHGITPDADPRNVERMLKRIRG